MSNEYYNLLEEKMVRLINKNQELKKQLEEERKDYLKYIENYTINDLADIFNTQNFVIQDKDKFNEILLYYHFKQNEEIEQLQQENQELKLELSGYRRAILNDKEMLGLQQENKELKEVIDKLSSQIKLYGKYNGEKCTRGFSMMAADFNKLLDILKEVE